MYDETQMKIINAAMELPQWNPCLEETDFKACGDVKSDLISFSRTYMKKVTPQMVRISIGLRTPELVDYVCTKMNMPFLKSNPLFERTVASHKNSC